MARQLTERWEGMETADLPGQWASIVGSPTIVGANPHLRLNAANEEIRSIQYADHATWTFGLRLNVADVLAANNTIFAALNDGIITHVYLRLMSDGSIKLQRGEGDLLLGQTVAGLIVNNVDYYIELQAIIDDAAGAFELRTDGTARQSGTGLDTRSSGGGAVADTLRLLNTIGGTSFDFDDIYLNDGSGAVNNGFDGDIGNGAVAASPSSSWNEWNAWKAR